MKTRILLCCLIALIWGCVDKVAIKNENFTQQPVILAELNSNGHLRVQVSLTTNIDEESINTGVDDANIRLWTKNSDGEDEIITDSFDYEKVDNAYYPTSSVETKEGGIYWVELELSNGLSYVSRQEKMPTTVEVSDIAYVRNELRAIFQDEKDEPNYYLAEFNIYGRDQTYFIRGLKVVSNDVLIDGNEKAYIGDYITISDDSFYVELNMQSLSNSSYLFYRNFLEQEDLNEGFDDEEGDPGWLFSKPPLNLYGNITEKESGKKVLGQFVISSISQENQIVE